MSGATGLSARDVRVQRTRNGYQQVVTEYGVVASYRGIGSHAEAARHAAELGRAAAVLDKHLPLRGPCGICGVPGMDQTHRVIDSIADLIRAGDDPEFVAKDFGYPPEVADACLVWTAKKGSQP